MKKLLLVLCLLVCLTSGRSQAQVFNSFVKIVDTANALQALNPNDIHKVIYLRGYTNAFDIAGLVFYYNPTSVVATNTTTVFKPTSYAGRWIANTAGSGTVTSFGSGGLSPLFSTGVANPTTTPTLSFTASNANTNTFYAGPISGVAGAPTFRQVDLSTTDTVGQLPVARVAGATSGTVTSVGITQPAAGITQSGSPVTTSGNITLALANDLAAVEAISTTGYVKRTGAETWSTVATVPTSDVSGGAALTKVDDTNVTLTLGGSPSTSLLSAASLTLGWSGTLSNAHRS